MATDPARSIAERVIRESVAAQQALLEPAALDAILAAASVITDALGGGGTVLLFGNGGSATDASHIAAELLGRFQLERRALPAIALADNQSTVTAIANDLGFEKIFARQIEALGQPGDVAIGLSTSGGSPNVLAGIAAARARGLVTIGFTGTEGAQLRDAVDVAITIASASAARIQEGHILVGHLLCELVEQNLS
jgi:D-sedoheptulose 7-phosphate isomerase